MKWRLIVLAASALFALGGYWSEKMHDISGPQRAGGRSPFALIPQLLMLWRSPLAGITKKSAALALIFGIHLWTYFTGLILIHQAIAMLLVSMGPMFVPLIDAGKALIHRKPIRIARRELIVAVILWVMVMTYLLLGGLTPNEQKGAALSLATAFLWSLFMWVKTSNEERITAVAIGNIATFVVTLFSPGAFPAIMANIWWLAGMGLVSSGVPHGLLAWARNKFENAEEPLMIQTIQPLLTFLIVGFAFPNKWPSKMVIFWGAGLLVILVGYSISKLREEKRLKAKVK